MQNQGDDNTLFVSSKMPLPCMKNFATCLTSISFAEDTTERMRFLVKSPKGFGRPVIKVLLNKTNVNK